MSHRRTLGQGFSLEGEGVRSGRTVRVTVEPAEAGAGLVLEAREAGQIWPLDLTHTVALPGCTAAGTAACHVAYIEHFLAACAGTGLSDARLVVEGPELPLLDGSARPWLDHIQEAGLEEFPDPLEPLVVTDLVMVICNGTGLTAFPADQGNILYLLEHPHPLIGRQCAHFLGETEEFARWVAPARTFTTVEEARYAQEHGLLRGGSEANALVVYPDHYSANPGLPEAFAAHKLLDLLGDLYLLGRPVQGHLIGHNSGHTLNRRFAEALACHAESGEPQFIEEGESPEG
jgi:UDP-3-O-[3-hydroxymyristoyl] N-acetylglucosamine deacetylase